jgi:hypothetical protein
MNDDDLDRRIADEVVRADVDAFAARRMRARAHDALRARRSIGIGLGWLEPVVALAFGGAQIVWALRAVLEVYR